MRTYKTLRKKAFESETKFENRLNEMAMQGWKAINIAIYGMHQVVLMEKEK